MKNCIPRHFYRITGRMLVDTNIDRAGDILHVSKNDYGCLALNMRTGKYAYAFVSMLRNPELFEILEVVN